MCNCSSLIEIVLPNSITTIGWGSFANCTSLVNIELPQSIETIDGYAFQGCTNLRNVICHAENVPNASTDIFSKVPVEEGTLRVPSESVNLYKNAEPWKNFYHIISIDGDTPDPQYCSTPIINYSNGKLSFSCETEGVEYMYEIKDNDIMKGQGEEIQLSATYYITVYATKAGYYNSDVATATLCWIDAEPKTEGMTSNIVTARGNAVLIKSNDGTLSIAGITDGTDIVVYSTSGQMVGSTKAHGTTSTVSTPLRSGTVAIVRIGDKSVKVVMK